jgi:abequosyltransferase
MMTPTHLSICIATKDRAAYLEETLEIFAQQIQEGIELVVVDGASADNTEQICRAMASRFPWFRYLRLEKNGGIDADYDVCVRHACGKYCWLFSDDDWPLPGAIDQILHAIDRGVDFVFVEAEVRDASMNQMILPSRAMLLHDEQLPALCNDQVFEKTAKALSFIGSCVVLRERWLAAPVKNFSGLMFPHMAPIFDAPLTAGAYLIAKPLIAIRYGNATWTAKSFAIWMFYWPELVWKLKAVSTSTKARVSAQRPWLDWRILLWQRAKGIYGKSEFDKLPAAELTTLQILRCRLIAQIPGDLAVALGLLISWLRPRSRRFLQAELRLSQFYRPGLWDWLVADKR